MTAGLHDRPSADDHASTSASVAARTTWAGSTPAVRGVSSRIATRSHGDPTAIRPASGQPRLACPATVSASTNSPGREPPRSPAGQPLVHLERPGLLEQVDDGVLV